MRTDNIVNYFSDMSFLDRIMDDMNKSSERYYHNLELIRDMQRARIVPVDEYKKMCRLKKYKTIDYGYYQANIHYDLFECDINKKDKLEDRIIYYFNHIDDDNIIEFFRINPFENQFTNYLRKIYNLSNDYTLKDIIDNYGNSKEKEIYQLLAKLGIINS